jgi:hypothetical protein
MAVNPGMVIEMVLIAQVLDASGEDACHVLTATQRRCESCAGTNKCDTPDSALSSRALYWREVKAPVSWCGVF